MLLTYRYSSVRNTIILVLCILYLILFLGKNFCNCLRLFWVNHLYEIVKNDVLFWDVLSHHYKVFCKFYTCISYLERNITLYILIYSKTFDTKSCFIIRRSNRTKLIIPLGSQREPASIIISTMQKYSYLKNCGYSGINQSQDTFETSSIHFTKNGDCIITSRIISTCNPVIL